MAKAIDLADIVYAGRGKEVPMSGPTTKAVYLDDLANSWCVRLPAWEANLANQAATPQQAVTACTTEPPLPKGFRRRKRYYRITATGKEGSITVLDPASPAYTSPIGDPIIVPLFNTATPGANNATYSGRTGEKERAI